jgi:hypothetical protein
VCSEPDIEGVCVLLESYDCDYAVCPDGTVWSRKSGEWRQKSTRPEHGHETVDMWRNGQRTRRRLSVLMREAFGRDEKEGNDDELEAYLRRVYELDDEELAAIFDSEDSDE